MLFKALTLLCLVFLSQGINCLTRSEVSNQYSPTLQRLRDICNVKYQAASREYNALVSQLNKNQVESKNATQTHINRIRNIITEAKKNASGSTVTCLKKQEDAASRLSTTGLNSCYSSSNTSGLNTVKNRFSTLASVASNTNAWCSNLNPLTSQLQSYVKCLSDKFADLNWQINVVQREYEELSNATLRFNLNCLTDKAGAILGQIGVISYEINVCFFKPLN